MSHEIVALAAAAAAALVGAARISPERASQERLVLEAGGVSDRCRAPGCGYGHHRVVANALQAVSPEAHDEAKENWEQPRPEAVAWEATQAGTQEQPRKHWANRLQMDDCVAAVGAPVSVCRFQTQLRLSETRCRFGTDRRTARDGSRS